MKSIVAIIGTAFVVFVSAAFVDQTVAASGPAVTQAAQHAAHADGKKCCDKAEGMCARDGKTDGKTDAKTCCAKENCCKDDCCKDGVCKDNCTCECCQNGSCCKHEAGKEGAVKGTCCKKPAPKKPALVPSH